jgi:hypothetical protein
MLFSDRLSEINSDPAFQKSRHKLVSCLLARFAESFPTVTFQPELSLRIINAQAVTATAGRLVKLYGGLAFHPSLDFHSLTLILLHEVGHHLSPGCRSPFDVTLACECEADHWSVTEGLDALNVASSRPLKVHEAIERLDQVFSWVEDETEKRLSKCWSARWPARKEALLKKTWCPGFCTT